MKTVHARVKYHWKYFFKLLRNGSFLKKILWTPERSVFSSLTFNICAQMFILILSWWLPPAIVESMPQLVQQQQLPVWVRFRVVWGDPVVGSLTPTGIPTRRETDSKRPTKRNFEKIIYRRKSLWKHKKGKHFIAKRFYNMGWLR